MIHRRQVIFPECIQNLQHDLLFNTPHIGADIGTLGVVSRLHRVDYSLPQALFVQLFVLIQPLLQWQLDGELDFQLFLQPRHIPLLLHAHRWDVAVDGLHHNVPPNSGDGLGNV